MPDRFARYLTLALCIGLPLLVGLVSGFATSHSVTTWYAGLKKPFFNPPRRLFAPVWLLLYILMGISLYRIWRSPLTPERTLALIGFAVQLVLNAAWTFIFFYFRRIFAALAEILLLWISILTMILLFRRVDGTAALLQIPYLAWVFFAALLTGAIYAKNPRP